MDLDWQHCPSFLAVMRQGSLSAAARQLGLTQPTLGRHVESLEAALGLPLFTRSQGGLQPTAAAHALLPMAEAMEAAAHALLRAAEGAAAAGAGATGTVRITASEMIGAEVLPPILARIRRAHPAIVLELALTNRAENLLRRDADIAVRMLRPAQSALLAQCLGTVQLGLFAHEGYLSAHGAPADIAALTRAHLIGFDRDDGPARALAASDLPVSRDLFSFRSDSDLAQAAAIRSGLGIGVMQRRIARQYPMLRPVLPGVVEFTLELWLAMHEDQRGNAAIQAVRAGLAEGLLEWLGA